MIISLLSLCTSLFLTKIKQVFWEVPIDLLEKIQFVSNLFLRKIKIICSGGSRIFPRGGVNPPGGAWTRQIFPKTAWNRKNLDAQGGACVPHAPPPRSANDMNYASALETHCWEAGWLFVHVIWLRKLASSSTEAALKARTKVDQYEGKMRFLWQISHTKECSHQNM